MAIRFKMDTTDEKWKVINVVVYEAQLERAKFNSPAATFTIYAKDKRDGPQVAIYPASGKELNDNIPLLWSDSLKANFQYFTKPVMDKFKYHRFHFYILNMEIWDTLDLLEHIDKSDVNDFRPDNDSKAWA